MNHFNCVVLLLKFSTGIKCTKSHLKQKKMPIFYVSWVKTNLIYGEKVGPLDNPPTLWQLRKTENTLKTSLPNMDFTMKLWLKMQKRKLSHLSIDFFVKVKVLCRILQKEKLERGMTRALRAGDITFTSYMFLEEVFLQLIIVTSMNRNVNLIKHFLFYYIVTSYLLDLFQS